MKCFNRLVVDISSVRSGMSLSGMRIGQTSIQLPKCLETTSENATMYTENMHCRHRNKCRILKPVDTRDAHTASLGPHAVISKMHMLRCGILCEQLADFEIQRDSHVHLASRVEEQYGVNEMIVRGRPSAIEKANVLWVHLHKQSHACRLFATG